jgi:hypothetical protein
MRTPRIPNRMIRQYVTERRQFTGSNTHGIRIGDSYVAHSYAAPIFIWAAGIWFENETRYSVTTSKHRNQMRPLFGEFVDLPADRMADLKEALLDGQPAEAVVAEFLIRSLPTP